MIPLAYSELAYVTAGAVIYLFVGFTFIVFGALELRSKDYSKVCLSWCLGAFFFRIGIIRLGVGGANLGGTNAFLDSAKIGLAYIAMVFVSLVFHVWEQIEGRQNGNDAKHNHTS